ncbi:outer membrane receptor for ferrienterochelin and colicin [Pseudoduganella flava]|uniref:Outer membrane receptor for ferrienterochelin and colicin n=1 Tax=Pseudoduganella flava TaxID=871742 RepID=A0A562PGZ8_9BURK|nr:TonB-dependent receptor [Pseudoduganella flava]QGZ42538.1 TonB-dependent receptor plug domain-containing protein [Pseudoduganella flava]TWI43689.1 outer membrane receptor for ferrienterochelin and colicin [Pseudoduganella flava]
MSPRLTAVAGALLATFSARAEPPTTATETAPAPLQTVEIKGAATAYDPRRDDTASKIVVSSEEIRRYGDTSVNDVLKRLPGITVSGAAGRSGGEIRMRGLGSGYTQILLNGERAPAGFSIDTLAPDVIERIEIVRAASAEFSTQSIAGTINIVLKKAVRTAQREVKIGAAKSADANNPNASVQLSDKDGRMSYSLGANFWRGTYARESPTIETQVDPLGALRMLRASSQRDDGRWEGMNIAPRINWNLADGDTLTSQTFVNVNRNRYHGYQEIDTQLGSPPRFDVRDMRQTNRNAFGRTDLNWVTQLTGGAKLDVKAGISGMRAEGTWHELDYRAGTLGRDATITSETTEQGFSTQGKYAVPWLADHALALGWDAGATRRDDSRVERDANLPGSVPENTDEGYDAKVNRLALYAQDEWNITPRWSVYAGLRWEGLETTSSGNTFDTVTRTNSVFSPLAQTLYKLPGSRDQLRLALTRTYKAPSAANLVPRRFTSTNNSQTEPDRRGNPDLQPELASGIDASYEHYWGKEGAGALLSAAASMRRISGYTRQGLLLEAGRWIATPVNDGSAVTRSVELEAKFPLEAVLAGAPAVDLRASVSRNWSRVDAVPGPDNRLDQQTPLSATLGADYKSRDGKLTTGASFAFKNGGPVRIDVNQTGYQSVRRDLDVYALWKFNPRYQLRVAVSNLLGQDYVSDSAYLDNSVDNSVGKSVDESGTRRRTSIYPGYTQGRATLEMRF